MTDHAPLTKSQRVEQSRARLVAAGGRRLPTCYLQPDAAAALDSLLAAGYGSTVAAVISAALLDAQRKVSRRSRAT